MEAAIVVVVVVGLPSFLWWWSPSRDLMDVRCHCKQDGVVLVTGGEKRPILSDFDVFH